MGIYDLPDGKTRTIRSVSSTICMTNKFSINDVSSFGSDGANVMTGCREGVATQLKSHNSSMISIHFVAHHLALATSKASQAIPYLRWFKEILSGLFQFYHNSPVRLAGLQTVI